MLTIKCFCDVANKIILGIIVPQGQYGTNASLRILQKDTNLKIFYFTSTQKKFLNFEYVKTSDLHNTRAKFRSDKQLLFF